MSLREGEIRARHTQTQEDGEAPGRRPRDASQGSCKCQKLAEARKDPLTWSLLRELPCPYLDFGLPASSLQVPTSAVVSWCGWSVPATPAHWHGSYDPWSSWSSQLSSRQASLAQQHLPCWFCPSPQLPSPPLSLPAPALAAWDRRKGGTSTQDVRVTVPSLDAVSGVDPASHFVWSVTSHLTPPTAPCTRQGPQPLRSAACAQ